MNELRSILAIGYTLFAVCCREGWSLSLDNWHDQCFILSKSEAVAMGVWIKHSIYDYALPQSKSLIQFFTSHPHHHNISPRAPNHNMPSNLPSLSLIPSNAQSHHPSPAAGSTQLNFSASSSLFFTSQVWPYTTYRNVWLCCCYRQRVNAYRAGARCRPLLIGVLVIGRWCIRYVLRRKQGRWHVRMNLGTGFWWIYELVRAEIGREKLFLRCGWVSWIG